MLKTIHDQHGRAHKMGRKRPTEHYHGKKLSDYMLHEALPSVTVPSLPFGYGTAAVTALGEMYGNDNWGDCVIAAVMHDEGVVSANAGDEVTYTMADVTTAYGWCGYVPNDPSTDQGCEVLPVLQKWVTDGLPGGGSKAAGPLAVDPTNQAEIQMAVYLFENLVFGMELPDAWVTPMPSASGFVWDVAGDPDPQNGHSVCGYDCTADGVSIVSWAMTGTITYAAVAEYCAASANGELYVMLTQDLINKASAKAPTGFDWAQLVADFDAMGGSVVAPTPSPTPTPTPTPTPSPSPIPPLPAGAVALPVGAEGIVVMSLHHGGSTSFHTVALPNGAVGIEVGPETSPHHHRHPHHQA